MGLFQYLPKSATENSGNKESRNSRYIAKSVHNKEGE